MEEEPNIWACINRMFEFNTEYESKVWDTKTRKRYINLGTGYSSTDEKEMPVFRNNVELTDVSDTCDEIKTRYRHDHKAVPDSKSTVSISMVGTELMKGSIEHSKEGELKQGEVDNKLPRVFVSSLVKEAIFGSQDRKWAFKFRKNPVKKHTSKKL